MPDDFVEHLIKDLGLNNQIYAQFSASSMRHKLEKAKEEWVNIKRKRSLHEHLQPRLLAAVRAVWEVEKKTVTDVVLKMCRDSIINRVAYWVETQMLTDKDIGDAAVEDASLRETRQQLITTIDNMEHVLKALGPIMKDTSPSPHDIDTAYTQLAVLSRNGIAFSLLCLSFWEKVNPHFS